jgi:hypothetical protein
LRGVRRFRAGKKHKASRGIFRVLYSLLRTSAPGNRFKIEAKEHN